MIHSMTNKNNNTTFVRVHNITLTYNQCKDGHGCILHFIIIKIRDY